MSSHWYTLTQEIMSAQLMASQKMYKSWTSISRSARVTHLSYSQMAISSICSALVKNHSLPRVSRHTAQSGSNCTSSISNTSTNRKNLEAIHPGCPAGSEANQRLWFASAGSNCQHRPPCLCGRSRHAPRDLPSCRWVDLTTWLTETWTRDSWCSYVGVSSSHLSSVHVCVCMCVYVCVCVCVCVCK